jgi:hypothetical protein
VTVLPRIDVVVALYRGDDEFPPDATLLFRRDIVDYVSLEDITHLAGILARKLSAAT